MPRQTSVQLTEATERQAAELKALGFGSMTDVIRTAIDRMYQQETRTMKAREQIVTMLKTIYDAGDVNAMQIWKGYDAMTGQTGWHYKWFGRSDAQYIGKSVGEVREFVDEAAATFRAQYVEAKANTVVYVEPAMLGDIATDADARRMVELLKERGYDARLGSALNSADVPDDDWGECLDIISQENAA